MSITNEEMSWKLHEFKNPSCPDCLQGKIRVLEISQYQQQLSAKSYCGQHPPVVENPDGSVNIYQHGQLLRKVFIAPGSRVLLDGAQIGIQIIEIYREE